MRHGSQPSSARSSKDRGDTSSGSSSAQYSTGEVSSGSALCNRTTGTLLSIAGGAALGGALMYLLDPEEGQSRRRYVSDLAGGAWETVRDTAGSAYETVREKAAGLGAATAAGASSLASSAGRGSRRLGRGIADSRVAKSIGRGTRNVRDEASDRMNYLVHGDQRTSYIKTCKGEALAALGCLALGVAGMYLLDPRDGARRRNVMRDKFMSGFGRMAASLDRLGRGAWNRTSGMVHELKSRRSQELVDDSTIVERVRANVGHSVPGNLHDLRVTAFNGRVTLSGSIPESDVDNVLKCAWSTRGVREIINQLNAGDVGTPGAGASNFSTARVTPTPMPAPMGSTITSPNPT